MAKMARMATSFGFVVPLIPTRNRDLPMMI